MGIKRDYVCALGFCILQGKPNVAIIQKVMHWNYARANTALNWMEENRYITPLDESKPSKLLLSLKQYKLSFGNYLNQDRLFRRKYEKELLALLANQ